MSDFVDRVARGLRVPVWMVDPTRSVPRWVKIPGLRWVMFRVRYRP